MLPAGYGIATIERIVLRDEDSTLNTNYWTHFTVSSSPTVYRVDVVTEPLPCLPFSRKSAKTLWRQEDPSYQSYLEEVRELTPRTLMAISDTLEAALLERPLPGSLTPPSGYPHRFTFLPTEGPLTAAYRDVPNCLGLRDPVTLVNALLARPFGSRRASIAIDFVGE
jgi:hypothetical protein